MEERIRSIVDTTARCRGYYITPQGLMEKCLEKTRGLTDRLKIIDGLEAAFKEHEAECISSFSWFDWLKPNKEAHGQQNSSG